MDRVRDYRPRVYWGFCPKSGKRQWCVRYYQGPGWSTPRWVFQAEFIAILIARHLNQSL